MSYVDLLFVVLIILVVIDGYSKGFFVSLLSLIRFAVGIPLSFIISDKFYQPVYTTCFREAISESVSNSIESTGLDNVVASIRDSVNAFPEALRGSVDLSFLNNASVASASEGIMNNVIDPIAYVVTRVVLFVLTLVIFYVLTWIIILIFKKLSNSKVAPFKRTNKFLGAVFGLAKGVVAVLALAKVGAFFVVNVGTFDNALMHQIASSFLVNLFI